MSAWSQRWSWSELCASRCDSSSRCSQDDRENGSPIEWDKKASLLTSDQHSNRNTDPWLSIAHWVLHSLYSLSLSSTNPPSVVTVQHRLTASSISAGLKQSWRIRPLLMTVSGWFSLVVSGPACQISATRICASVELTILAADQLNQWLSGDWHEVNDRRFHFTDSLNRRISVIRHNTASFVCISGCLWLFFYIIYSLTWSFSVAVCVCLCACDLKHKLKQVDILMSDPQEKCKCWGFVPRKHCSVCLSVQKNTFISAITIGQKIYNKF